MIIPAMKNLTLRYRIEIYLKFIINTLALHEKLNQDKRNLALMGVIQYLKNMLKLCDRTLE